MRKSLVLIITLLLSANALAGVVTFNDSNLLEAVKAQYEAQVGVPLSDPPTSEELSNSEFTSLDASYLNIQYLTGLEACTALEALNLIGNQITDLSPLGDTTYGGLTNLSVLMLGKNQITDISPLSNLAGNLNVLDIGYNQISDISTLSTFTNLIGLNLGFGVFVGLYPEGVDFFATGVNDLDDADLNVLTNLTNLGMLSIGGLENVTSIAFLNSLSNLTQLYLGNNPISDWTPLGAVDQNLNVFAEFNCGLTQSAVDNYVVNMTNITFIDEDNPGILAIIEVGTGSDINDISGLSGLNPLMAFLLGIEIDDISVVSNWTNLSIFVCAFTGIQSLDALINLPNLTSVSVPGNNIGPNMFTQPISTPFSNLTELSVSENDLEDLSGVEYMPNLENLTAEGNQIDNIWVMDLDGAPKTTLEELNLGNNQIQDINPLLNYTALNEVNLSDNQIENFGYLVDNVGIGPGDNIDISYNPVPPAYCGIVDQLGWKVLPGGSLNRAGVCEASIEVEIVGEGITNPPVGITPIAYNSSFAIRAYPQSGSNYAFKQWERYDDGLGDYVLLTENPSYGFSNITENIKVRAVFVDIESTYTITFNLTGNGAVDEFPQGLGVYRYIAGRQVNLYALSGPGAYFAGWTGDVSSSGTQLFANILMDGDKTVGAVFEETGYTLTTGVLPDSLSGGVFPFPGTYYYAEQAEVTLYAWGNIGNKFDHWEDENGSQVATVNPVTITMDSDKVFIAVFVPIVTYKLTINTNPFEGGNTNPPVGEHWYEENSTVYVFANPNPGWFFTQWTGDIGGANPFDNFIEIQMDGNKEITANFEEADFTLELYIDGADKGEITPAPGIYYYKIGQWIFLNATNYQPNAFLGWYDYDTNDLISTSWFYAFEVEEGMTLSKIVGKFGVAQYLVTMLEVQGNGTTEPSSPGTYGYVDGQWCTLIAHPDPGWRFKYWVDENEFVVDIMNPFPVEFNPEQSNYTYRAVFEECDWNVNYAIAGTGTGTGTIIPGPGSQCYKDNEQVYLQAITDEENYFGGWQILKNPGPNQEETWEYWVNAWLTVNDNYDVIGWFEDTGYSLQLESGPNGSIYPYAGIYYLADGFPVTVYASPNPGYAFVGWFDESDNLVTIENPYEFLLNSNTVLRARFEQIVYKSLTINVESGQGTTVPSPGQVLLYEVGTLVQLTAIPNEGWMFDTWTGDLEGVGNPNQPSIQVLMDRDRIIGVQFKEIPEGASEGEGTVEGTPEGIVEGEGAVEGTPEGVVEGEGAVEGTPEGIVEGEGAVPPPHSADKNGDGKIDLSELLRVIQFFNFGGYHCDPQGEDGYAPGPGEDYSCTPHASDYNPQDWTIRLDELLRLIQFFNLNGYYPCEGGEDGFCPGQQP